MVGVNEPKAKYKVVLGDHADEISRFVDHCSEKGMIHVVTNAGSDYQNATSKRFTRQK